MMFSWCQENRHKVCPGSYPKFYIDNKTNKPVYTGETVTCVCKKRGCDHYVKPAERKTIRTRRRKK